MLCDTCTKSKVCRLKEDCNRLERSITGNQIEDILSVEIKCREHYPNYMANSGKLGQTSPLTGVKPTCGGGGWSGTAPLDRATIMYESGL